MQYMVYNTDLAGVVDEAVSLEAAGEIIAAKLEAGCHTLGEFAIYEKKCVQFSVQVEID